MTTNWVSLTPSKAICLASGIFCLTYSVANPAGAPIPSNLLITFDNFLLPPISSHEQHFFFAFSDSYHIIWEQDEQMLELFRL
jgi:hypothetical protein